MITGTFKEDKKRKAWRKQWEIIKIRTREWAECRCTSDIYHEDHIAAKHPFLGETWDNLLLGKLT